MNFNKNLIILSFLLIFICNFSFHTQEKKETMVKRKISILPFYNENKIKEYNHIANIIRDTLFSKLRDEKNFNLIEINKTDNTIKRYQKNRYISEEIKNIKIALKLNADVIIIGKYRITDEIIYIEVNVYDIIKESNIINENIKSSIDIDIYQNIDNLAQKISNRMKENIDIVKKDYYEKRLNEIENKLKEQPEKVINIEGRILVINSQFNKNKFDGKTNFAIYNLLKLGFYLHNCDFFFINITNNHNKLFNIKSVLDEAKKNNFNYIILYSIKEIANKPNIIFFKIIKVSTHQIIIGKKIETLHNKFLNNDTYIETVIQNTASQTDELILFKKGIDFTIGCGIYPTQINLLLLNNNFSRLAFKTGVYLPISFNYLLSPSNSIGFVQKMGGLIGLQVNPTATDLSSISPEFSLTYMLGMKHKIGNPAKKYRFILEYGIELYLNLFNTYSYDEESYSSSNYSTDSNYTVNIGPQIFFGYEYFKNKYSFENGFFFGSLFNIYSYQDNFFPIKINMGIELRFNKRFNNYYYKKLKRN